MGKNQDKNDNKGKCVVITGAGGGMGSATAELLAEKGFTVFALDKKFDAPKKGVIPVETDVTDEESVARAYNVVRLKTEKLFAIIHFAGIYRLDSLCEMSEERFTGIFNVNVFGAYRVNKAFLPLIKKGGRIIVTTSELAPLDPLPFTGIYAVTKTALEKYAFSLRMELQLLGVTVTVLRPGAVKTGLLPTSTRELDAFCENTRVYTYNAGKFRKIVNDVETKSVTPERIAKTVLKILSARKPRYVYNVNRNPLLRLLNALPDGWQTKIIGGILKGKGDK